MTEKLVVGGAQFGASYGIANTTGAPAREAVHHIFSQARDAGVNWIDTARAYPGSEAAIGEALREIGAWPVRITTKLPPLGKSDGGGCDGREALAATIRQSLAESRRLLQRSKLDAVLLHRWEDFKREGGLVAEILREEQEAGRVGAFGVSVQTPEELEEALAVEFVQHIQLPVNILDYRWEAIIPAIRCSRRERSLRVHARSLLLQGLLVSDRLDHWRRAHIPAPAAVRSWLQDQVRAFNRRSIQDLCLAWGRAQDWIDGIVVGAETPLQMAGNLHDCTTPLLEAQDMERIRATRPQLAQESLNPARWARP